MQWAGVTRVSSQSDSSWDLSTLVTAQLQPSRVQRIRTIELTFVGLLFEAVAERLQRIAGSVDVVHQESDVPESSAVGAAAGPSLHSSGEGPQRLARNTMRHTEKNLLLLLKVCWGQWRSDTAHIPRCQSSA